MAESKAKIEFQAKKELFEAIVDNVVCSYCEVVPRKGPIYQSKELIPKNEDSDDESERPAKRPKIMVRKISCGECLPNPDEDKRFQRNVALENMLFAYPITSCKFRRNDCKIVQDLKNIEYHEEDCQFRDVHCPLYFCDFIVPVSDLKKHILEIHDFDIENEDSDLVINDKVFTLKNSNIYDENEDGNYREFYYFRQDKNLFVIQLYYTFESDKECLMIWIQLWGSKFEAKNYNCLIQMGDSTHGRFMFKGPVKSLDDSGEKNYYGLRNNGLIVSLDFAKKFEKFIDDEGSLTVEIEIENLKLQEEQADYEEPMEAASTAYDDKEKDTKN